MLLIEGGRIDHGSHASNASGPDGRRRPERGREDRAAQGQPGRDADRRHRDHSHTLIISGYAKRSNLILGISVGVDGEPIRERMASPTPRSASRTGRGLDLAKTPDGRQEISMEQASAPISSSSLSCRWIARPTVARISGSMPLARGRICSRARGRELHLPRDGLRLEDQRAGEGQDPVVGQPDRQRRTREETPPAVRRPERPTGRDRRRPAAWLPGAWRTARPSSRGEMDLQPICGVAPGDLARVERSPWRGPNGTGPYLVMPDLIRASTGSAGGQSGLPGQARQ